MTITRNRRVAIGAVATLLAVSLTACSGNDDGGGGGGEDATAEEIEAALEEGGSLAYWTWTPQAETQIAAFEEAYPNVDVSLVDTVGAGEGNTKLQNAIAAGDGVPDVVQIEYKSIPQFQLPGQLTDLTQYGFDELESLYTPSTWGAVAQNGGIWGLPQDSGPMAFFYNKEVYDEVGVEVPTTWDEYADVARAIKEHDPDTCIGNDSGDAGFTTSMIWQAGGTPFQTEGDQVTIDLADEGTTRFAEMYQPLIDEELLCEIPGWSDEWYAAMGDGTIASVPIGAWMPGVLEDGVPDGKGKWRVAPMPTYDGTPTNAENGGSTESIPGAAENKLLAAGFLKWLNSSDESIQAFMDTGGFPATVEHLESEDFLNYESEYFGGQKINEVLGAGAADVNEGWQYLPWQSYADSIFPDTVGQAWLDNSSLMDGFAAWQEENVSYGTEQGFAVNGG